MDILAIPVKAARLQTGTLLASIFRAGQVRRLVADSVARDKEESLLPLQESEGTPNFIGKHKDGEPVQVKDDFEVSVQPPQKIAS